MAGRFSARRIAPEFPPMEAAAAPAALAAAAPPPAPPEEAVAWTVFPEAEPDAAPIAPLMLAPAPAPAAPAAAPPANPLLTDKLLDAKVRLHRKLIEEINLSALEKLPEEEIRKHVQQLVSQYILVERLALNAQELSGFVDEILDEMTGLGPIEPLLKDATVSDI